MKEIKNKEMIEPKSLMKNLPYGNLCRASRGRKYKVYRKSSPPKYLKRRWKMKNLMSFETWTKIIGFFLIIVVMIYISLIVHQFYYYPYPFDEPTEIVLSNIDIENEDVQLVITQDIIDEAKDFFEPKNSKKGNVIIV